MPLCWVATTCALARRPGCGRRSSTRAMSRDVCGVMTGRLEQILAGGGALVEFANWDQDATAAEQQYWRSDPTVVEREVTDAFDAAATAYGLPVGYAVEWPALRSNGSPLHRADPRALLPPRHPPPPLGRERMTLPSTCPRLPEPRTPDPHDAPAIRWGILAPGRHRARVRRRRARSAPSAGRRGRLPQPRAGAGLRRRVRRSRGPTASYEELVADTEVDAVYVASPHSRAPRPRPARARGRQAGARREGLHPQRRRGPRGASRPPSRAGLLVVEAMWSRFLPHYDVVRQVVESGLIGEVVTRLRRPRPAALSATVRSGCSQPGARRRGAARPRRLPGVVRRPRPRRARRPCTAAAR